MKAGTKGRRAVIRITGGIALAVVCSLTQGGTLRAGEDGMRLMYKAGDGLKIGDGNNLIHLQGRLQGRFTYSGLDGAPDTDGFTVQRGKIKIEGHTLEKKLKFGFQMNLATRNRASTATACISSGAAAAPCPAGTASVVTAESTTGLAALEDYYMDWVPGNLFGVKVGQFKVPFLMQELTSSGKQQFVDRSLANGFFNLARDIGVNLHGDLLDGRLNYALFAMNGDGINTINRNKDLLLGTRLELPILGEYKPSESDTENSSEPNLGVGVAYALNRAAAAFSNNTIAAGTRASHGTVDIGYKYKGWSFQGAGMIQRTHEGTMLTNWGYNAQAGYFLVPKVCEVALKTNGTIFSGAVVNQYEYAAGLNYFIRGHGIKLQTDYALLRNNRGQGLNDQIVRTQMQVIF